VINRARAREHAIISAAKVAAMKKVLARTAKHRATRAQALADIAAAHSAAATERLQDVTGRRVVEPNALVTDIVTG